MANYIQSLGAEVAELRRQRDAAHMAILDFRAHLALPKFRGEHDGERKDWIAVRDVHLWLDSIATELDS
jgi:hypothetical protein